VSQSVLLEAKAIADIVEKLASEVSAALPEDFIIVGLMDGALVFAADFLRALHARGFNPVFESLCLSSYGDAHVSSGRVVCLKDITRPVKDHHVLILDDVFESGLTLDHARRHIMNLGAASVQACVFAQKPYDDIAGTPPEYIGWQAPDKFLIGYGLDDKGRHRGQPFIGFVDSSDASLDISGA